AQRVLDGCCDPAPGQALLHWTQVRSHLGDQHKLIAPARMASEPAPDEGFGFSTLMAVDPARIAVRRVHSVQPGVRQRIEQPEGSGLVSRPAEYVSAKHQGR